MRSFVLISAITLSACNGGSQSTDDTSLADDTGASDSGFTDRFGNLTSATEVSCTLSDGSSAKCWELVFDGTNPDDDGPYCPETIDDVGGVGVYDGDTNPGFQVMKRALWEAMEADGYDIVDEDGNISIVDGTGGAPSGPSCMALPAMDLTMKYLVPVEPVLLSTASQLATVEHLGVQLDGIPMTADPPSVVDGPPIPGATGGNIPSIDPCGGHPDPAGYYHAHFVPDSINMVLDSYGITEVGCTRVPQQELALMGFAKDGFPVYSASASEQPTDLDSCNGKTGPTAEFPDGIYHYYASPDQAPNMPGCLMGAFVEQGSLSYE